MTKVEFLTRNGFFAGMRATGHSGYSAAGSDIVCAAVSTAFGIVECAVNDVAKVHAPVASAKKNAALSVTVPEHITEEQRTICDSAMRAAYLWLSENLREYGAFVEISTRERSPKE